MTADESRRFQPANPVQAAVGDALDRVFGDRDRQQQTQNAELAHARAEAERLSRDWPAYHQAEMQRQQAALAQQLGAQEQQLAAARQQLGEAQAAITQLAAERAARDAYERRLAEQAEFVARRDRTATLIRLLGGMAVGYVAVRFITRGAA